VPTKQISAEALLELRLATLPPRSHERRLVMQATARLYGVSEPTLYRALAAQGRPKLVRRADRGTPRVLPQEQLERYCELIAAIKVRTSNKKQRPLSTAKAIRLLEDFGLETPEGFVQAPKGRLTRTTVNRYLQQWGFDRTRLLRQPAAVRFQAEHSHACRQFDLSPSDLKAVKAPSWVRPEVGAPTLMLFSVVDDRSGVAYQEYHGVYGEDVEAALRFLFNAMAPKPLDDFPFHGIPSMIYLDNGPIARKVDPVGEGPWEWAEVTLQGGLREWPPWLFYGYDYPLTRSWRGFYQISGNRSALRTSSHRVRRSRVFEGHPADGTRRIRRKINNIPKTSIEISSQG
jgi:hypothetical protein